MNVIGNPRGGKKFAAQIVTVNLLVSIQGVRLPFGWFSLNKFFDERLPWCFGRAPKVLTMDNVIRQFFITIIVISSFSFLSYLFVAPW